jgi:hypothetical protein
VSKLQLYSDAIRRSVANGQSTSALKVVNKDVFTFDVSAAFVEVIEHTLRGRGLSLNVEEGDLRLPFHIRLTCEDEDLDFLALCGSRKSGEDHHGAAYDEFNFVHY